MLTFTPTPATFVVEEIPAYLPSGVGEHTFLWIEKVDLTTFEAVRRIARAAGVEARDVGYAGMKDRHATTRQWISVPRLDPERAAELAVDGARVLEARRHGNKLRTGHLHGNRFEIVLTPDRAAADSAPDDDAGRVRERLLSLARAGIANRYGEQRFGATGDNAAQGLALLRGERRERDGRRRRLLLSAAQSAVFNRYLDLRGPPDGVPAELLRVRAGDVLQKTASGGLFVCTDVSVDQARVDAGELLPTGPMPGSRVTEPPPDSEAGRLEQQALDAVQATRDDFARAGRDLPGARRPVLVRIDLGDPAVSLDPVTPGRPYSVRARFGLPAGSYATVVIDHLLLADTTGQSERSQAQNP
ncbi:MAG TPA: tRNA pseudouridine(13) synthase TruD [Polyangia bacterium]|nr:tRNA pseudouridine(13) synthase TruD [Polyangia bacterium]